MLSSTDQLEDIVRCRKLGIAAFLTKPIQQGELREAILTALGKKSADISTCLASSSPTAKSLHILLAEDQPVNQLLATRMLQKRGHTVVVAGNGRAALDQLAYYTTPRTRYASTHTDHRHDSLRHERRQGTLFGGRMRRLYFQAD
jgi:two-component system sensor histidine kinase/response regulator